VNTVIVLSPLYTSGEFLDAVGVGFGKRTLCYCENCALLGCYTASSGIPLPTFWINVSVPSSRVKKPKRSLRFLTLEDGTDRLTRNFGKELPLLAA
jgi:hypothetical protein